MKTRKGGWYCSECGGCYSSPGWGAITCASCGSIGLRQFVGALPRRVPCPVSGCKGIVWDDGGVNSGESQHRWARHATAEEPS